MELSPLFLPKEYSDLYPPRFLPELKAERIEVKLLIDKLTKRINLNPAKLDRKLMQERGFWVDEVAKLDVLIGYHKNASAL